MRQDRFKDIHDLFSDYFEKEAIKINSDFLFVTCNVHTFFPRNDLPPGVSSFNIGLDCLLKDADLDKTDNLALAVEVLDESEILTMNADICWGHPYARTEKEIFETYVAATNENLKILQERLPELILLLRKIIMNNPKGI